MRWAPRSRRTPVGTWSSELCGLLGVFAVAAIGRRLLGSWAWGLVAAATLMAIPMWPGLSMFDIKDVPAATGYTLVTWALVELLFQQPPRWRTAWGPIAILTTGLILAIGSRPGLWPGLAASLGVAALLAWKRPGIDGSSSKRLMFLSGFVAVAGALAYLVLWISYPAVFSRPHEWLLGSVVGSADYTGTATGSDDSSWAYLPGRVAVVMPPLLLLIGAVGMLTLVPKRLPRVTPEVCGWLLVATQALLLPVLAIVRQSLLYDDLRQLLFACPAVALLLTAGWKKFVADLGRESTTTRSVLGLVWSLALLAPMAVQIQLFPYGYSYAAPQAVAAAAAIENDWGRVSLRELLPQVPEGEFVICHPLLSAHGETLRSLPPTGRPAAEASSDCRTDPMSTLTPYGLADEDPNRYVVDDTFLALFSRGRPPGRNCEVLGSVERWRYLARVVMSTAARCDLVLNAYPVSGVTFGPDGSGAEFLLGGWTSHPSEPGVRLREPFGSFGFELPESWAATGLRLRLEGLASGVPEVWVNNELVAVTSTGSGWVVEVPAEVVKVMGERRLVVTVAQPAGEPLVLTGVSAAPS